MRYRISGKQIEIGEALSTHVRSALEEILGKYSQRPTDAQVVFSRDAHNFVCEATVHLSSGLTAQAKAQDVEIYAAFDACGAKMDKQLRRYKRRLKNHHRDRAADVEVSQGASYILARHDEDREEDDGDGHPIIIAEMETKISTLAVGDAVMQMELNHSPVLVFRNEKTEGLNVVYRREDGNIGWIDPKPGG